MILSLGHQNKERVKQMFNIFANVIKTATRQDAWGQGRETHPLTRQNKQLRHEREQREDLKRHLRNARNFSTW